MEVIHVCNNGNKYCIFHNGNIERGIEEGNILKTSLNVISDCGNVPHVPGADNKTLINGSTEYPTSATYECKEGYVPSGNNSIHCQSDGNWSTTTFSCTIQGKTFHSKIQNNTKKFSKILSLKRHL